MKQLKPLLPFAGQLLQMRDGDRQIQNQVTALDYPEHMGYYHPNGYLQLLRSLSRQPLLRTIEWRA